MNTDRVTPWMRPGVTFGIMDLNQYLEKMNTTTRVIIIQIDEIIGA